MTTCPRCGQKLMMAKPGELCGGCKRRNSKSRIALVLSYARHGRAMAAIYAASSKRHGYGSRYEQLSYLRMAEGYEAEARDMLSRCWP